MANFFDYLDWYGDFDFATVPFNEVDNLILSQLAYVRLDGAVGEDELVVAPELQERFLALHRTEPGEGDAATDTEAVQLPDNGPLIDKSTNLLLGRMAAAGRRFATARVGYYVSVTSEDAREQFAAVTIALSDGSLYVAFRGTDDSVVGWVEDCEMGYHVVPSQEDAAAYLRRIARSTIGPLRVGGHSKGGNLAAYAAWATPELDARIKDVWCNDSPGFVDEVVPLAGFARLTPRMRLFTPEYGVVAALFDHPVEAEIVVSSGKGVMAHSLVSWQVMRDHVLRADGLLTGAVEVNHAFRALFDDNDLAQRARLVDELAHALADSDVHSIGDLMGWGNPRPRQLVNSMEALSDESRQTVQNLLVALTGGALKGEMEEQVAAASKALAPVAEAVGSALAEAERRGRELIAARPGAAAEALPAPEDDEDAAQRR